MAGSLIRILSDVHFGDRASRVAHLPQLRPLFDGVDHLILNGDTLDTRPGPAPAHTADCIAQVRDFFPREVADVTFLSGNHDANFTPHHRLDLAVGQVFVTHGDVIFDDIVPWGVDATFIRRRLVEEMSIFPEPERRQLDQRLAVFRRVAGSIPQRHQSERHRLKYAASFLADTVWPPWRVLRILRAWRDAPQLAAALAREHRPAAKFIVTGHTHRPGVWTNLSGVTVINTGSYCRPLGGTCVDVAAGRLTVRRIEPTAGEFRPGAVLAEFPLAET